MWWYDVQALCRTLSDQVPGAAIAGVCVSGLGPCVVPCDASLRPLRPALLYGIDTRSGEEIAELDQALGREEIFARGGSYLSSQALGPKLRWIAKHEPEVWSQAALWCTATSFIVARLTGDWVLDHHSASQCDPLYDLRAGAWIPEWAQAVARELPLPRLAWPAEPAGTVTPGGADATGLPVGTPVMTGSIDAWSEAFSVGARHPGDLMLMYGSTMFLIAVLDEMRTHPALWATAGIEPGLPTLAGGMATSGTITEWLRRLTGDTPFDSMVREARDVPAGARGLLILPYFAGERTPIFDPAARGVIAGLTLEHGRGELLRAVYEAIAFGVRHNVAALVDAGARPERVLAVGGGTRGGLWTQIVSDVTQLAQELPRQTIGAAYGDALLAAIGTGLVPADTDWTTIETIIEPDPASAHRYDELFANYLELYSATSEIVHRLVATQQSDDGVGGGHSVL